MRRNRILLVAAILASGVYVGFHGGSISYLLFYSTLLIPLLSLTYVFIVYWKFCIYQKIENKVLVKEERVPYLFKLSNEDILSYTKIRVNFMKDYSTVEDMDQSTDYCLIPQEEIHRETKICCHYRGEYNVGINNVTVTDYLNLFRFTYACSSVISVKVLPRVLHLTKLVIAPDCEDIKKQEFYTQAKDEIPDVEVRNYQTSDSPKMIHWKATARQGQLLTRKYTEEPKTELIILLDLRSLKVEQKERMIVEDKLIEALLAIVDYFVRNNTPLSILWDLGQLHQMKIYSKEEFQQLYEMCSEVKFRSEISSETLLTTSMQLNSVRQYGILLTGQMSDELCRTAYQYMQYDNELSIVIAGKNLYEEQIKKLDKRISFYRIGEDEEVRDVLEMEVV